MQKCAPRTRAPASIEGVVFPKDFTWGVATSAYQIEGATEADGRGESIWDRFARTPGNVEDGSDGRVACNHYALWREDVAIMKRLGVKAYRFSIAWPRVIPGGTGAPDARGLDFYSRLVDALLEAGIEPFATLYHWDLPLGLEDVGGWPSRVTAEAFVAYADAVAQKLGDRVKRWITHNEPWCASMLGYQEGRHAPGIRDWPRALAASHHLLLSHGWATRALRARVKGAEIGITLNLTPAIPASPSREDYEAYRQFDGYFNRWFLDPVFGRGYPSDMVQGYAARGYLLNGLRFVGQSDLDAINAPIDFLGVNYYTREVARSRAILESENLPRTVTASRERTAMGWEVYPQGLFDTLVRVHTTYAPKKIYVTENGAAFADVVGPDGRIADRERVRYLEDHFKMAARAIAAGVPLAGYFVWSLLDNFEWERGYKKRFGLVHVDYASQRRTLKDSALFYQRVIGETDARERANEELTA